MILFALMKSTVGAHTGHLPPRDSTSPFVAGFPGPNLLPTPGFNSRVLLCLGAQSGAGHIFPAAEERSDNGSASSLHWRFCSYLGTSARPCSAGP